jgi:HSP20 family molecular chaperone IbpA
VFVRAAETASVFPRTRMRPFSDARAARPQDDRRRREAVMATRIELRVDEVDGELVIQVEAPGLLPHEHTVVEAIVEDGVLEVRAPKAVTHVPGFHPEATPS